MGCALIVLAGNGMRPNSASDTFVQISNEGYGRLCLDETSMLATVAMDIPFVSIRQRPKE